MINSELYRHWETFHKGMDAKSLQVSFANHLEYSLSKDQYTATTRDLYHALALTVRDRLVERWIRTQQTYYHQDAKFIYYISAEYLMGRALVNNLINLDLYDQAMFSLRELNISPEELIMEEPDAGLGNGGLGRLAACFLDSLATLELPAVGYGIRYEFGIFDQAIRHCAQVEYPDEWLKFGNPWEIARPERSYIVRFYGTLHESRDGDGNPRVEWRDTHDVVGMGYDTPIDGYGNNTVNTLRLWAARASKEFDLNYFQHGDYLKAVEEKNISENISKVLYPNDSVYQGQELRLKQQYFFVSCSIQDIIRRYLVNHGDFKAFADKVAIQLNDTHPSLAIAELMRLLMDVHGLGWEESWEITTRVFAYTNHTLMSEALERWPVPMFERLLPRHLSIVFEINRRFLRDVSVFYTGDPERLRNMSLIEEGETKKVRMAHLAIVGSHSVNGVSDLHTRLLKERVLADFNRMYPERFNNKTNGITPRRWLVAANPWLCRLITEHIGEGWPANLDELRKLEPHLEDLGLQREFRDVKKLNKEKLARLTRELTGTQIDPTTIFDVQVKRIHEYKRQLLNILHVVSVWLALKEGQRRDYHPHTFIFGGKAAPSYVTAKLTIRLICLVSEMINRDQATRDRLRVVFLPNYRVYLAEQIIPAADVSEQISAAGYEASGTSNMKFALNGALTIGTLDGANVEISEEVGLENIFIFGRTADEIAALRPTYRPRDYVDQDPLLGHTLDMVRKGFFNPEEPELFRGLIDGLLDRDDYFVLADFAAYRDAHMRLEQAYRDVDGWTKMALLNVARSGKFSSDRTIREYNRDIWKSQPVPVPR